jgi:hypothetical protein
MNHWKRHIQKQYRLNKDVELRYIRLFEPLVFIFITNRY